MGPSAASQMEAGVFRIRDFFALCSSDMWTDTKFLLLPHVSMS